MRSSLLLILLLSFSLLYADESDVFDTIVQLQQMYEVIKSPEQRKQLNEDERIRLHDQFVNLVQGLPESVIFPQIEKYQLSFPAQYEAFKDRRLFVGRLAEKALEGIISTGSRRDDVPELVFSGNFNSQKRKKFYSREKTIFASFPSAGLPELVLIKWFHVDNGEMLTFKQVPVDSREVTFIWVKHRQGFVPGRYRVEVFLPDEQVTLIYQGEYTVETAGVLAVPDQETSLQ